MKIFEYATVELYFLKYKNEKGQDVGHMRKGFIGISIYESDGKSPGKAEYEKIELDEEYYLRKKPLGGGYYREEVMTHYGHPIFAMGPYLAMLGQRGWEVVEYKTSGHPTLGQVLLKREVQK